MRSINELAEAIDSEDVDSVYVGRVEMSIDSFPIKALMPIFCIVSARMTLTVTK